MVVGDSRVHGASWKPVPGWKVRVVAESAAILTRLIEMANQNIGDHTKILIVIGFQCDLTQGPKHGGKMRGLLRLRDPVPLTELTTVVTTWDDSWKKDRGLSIIYT